MVALSMKSHVNVRTVCGLLIEAFLLSDDMVLSNNNLWAQVMIMVGYYVVGSISDICKKGQNKDMTEQ